jgi:hypothetical protein
MINFSEARDYPYSISQHGVVVGCLQSADSASDLSVHQGRTYHSEAIGEGAVAIREDYGPG